MGFSLVAAAAIIGVSLVLIIEVFSGVLLPAISEVNDSYSDLKDRAVDVVQTDINVTGVTEEVASWWNENWNYRKSMTIDHNEVAGGLSNFPVLVDITDTDLRDDAQPDGDDIAFVNSDHTVQYHHEIELYNSTNGHLVAWVNVTSVSSASDTVFYMYYGHATCGSQENPTGVWDSNYVVVQHLNETGSGTRNDSTTYGNDGSPSGYDGDEATTNGKINGADDFDGVNDLLDCGNDSSLPANAVTVEAWFKLNNLTKDKDSIVNSGHNNMANPGFKLQFRGDVDQEIRWAVGNQRYSIDSSVIADTNWHHVAATAWESSGHLADAIELYLDGALINSSTGEHGVDIDYEPLGLFIGADVNNGNPFNGTLDEVRISNVTRNTSWINTSYNNQNSPSTFLNRGDEAPKSQQQVYLNITVKNVGSTSLKTTDFSLLINGTVYQFTSSASNLYPENQVYLTTITTFDSGSKRVKVITHNNIADYYDHTGP